MRTKYCNAGLLLALTLATSGLYPPLAQAYLQPPSQTYMPPSGLTKYISPSDCDIYVSKDGNDSNTGASESQAVRSFETGLNKTSNGKTMCIKAGTYSSLTITNRNGTQAQPITVGGYQPGSKVIIDGNNYTLPGLSVTDSNYVHIIGLEVTKAKKSAGVTVEDSNNIDLVNLNVHHNLGNGLNVKSGSKVRIEHSQFWYNIMDRKLTGKIGGGAIQVHTTREAALRWNRVYRNFGEGINIGRNANMILIEENQAWENDHTAYYFNRASNILFHANLMICTGDKSQWHQAEGIPGKKDSTGKAFTFTNEDANANTRLLCKYDGGGNNAMINNISMGCTTHFAMQMQDEGVCPAPHGKTLIANNTMIDARKDTTSQAKTPDFIDMSTSTNAYTDTVLIANNVIASIDPTARIIAQPNVANHPKVTFSGNVTNKDPGTSEGFNVTNLPFAANYSQAQLQDPPNIDPILSNLENNLKFAKLTSNSPAVDNAASIAGFPMFTSYLQTDYFLANRSGSPDSGAHEYDGIIPPTDAPGLSPTPNNDPTPITTILSADFNDDGIVDIEDMQLFIPKFNTSDDRYNINGKNRVDIFDFTTVITQILNPNSPSTTPTPSTKPTSTLPTITPTTPPSPEQSLIVFTALPQGGTAETNEIYTIWPDGSHLTRLTNNNADDQGAVISPDRTKIAFKTNRDDCKTNGKCGDNYNIYIMDIDGSNQVRLTNDPAHDQGASWSPDGSRIAFGSQRSNGFHIYVMNADGSNQTKVTQEGTRNRTPNWHPSQNKLAYTCTNGKTSDGANNTDICIINTDGTNNVKIIGNQNIQESVPSWSPDGSRILYKKGANTLRVVNANGTNDVSVVSDGEGGDWSPDGSKIIFDSNRPGDGTVKMYIANADGSNQTRVNGTPINQAIFDIDWR